MKNIGKKVVSETELISEWDFEANEKIGLNPNELTLGSSKKAWWICKKCQNKWQTQISVRNKGHNCPKCGAQKVGNNNATIKSADKSLLAVFPNVVKVWNYEKNGNLKPENISAYSNKKVWWKCSECGKEWQSSICGRAANSGKTTCKGCSLRNSKRVYLRQGVNDLVTVCPKVAVEWDYEKNIGLAPNDVTAHSSQVVWWKCKNGHEWKASILNRTKDGYRGCPYCANRRVSEENNLQVVNPVVSKEWNYKKNGTLTPSDITANSNKKVWWICENGHEWQASPNNRMRTNCPYCANQKLWSGFNDLATKCPKLAEEWNYKRNGVLKPQDIMFGSTKKVWWICEKGHEWQASPSHRAKAGCPYCSNRKVLTGFNDLATINPSLAKEWNYKKNKGLTPQNIIAGSPKKVWWICENGHEWQATIVSRNKGHYCPICDTNKHTSVSEKAFAYYLRLYGVEIEESKKIERRELDIFIPKMQVGIEYDGQYYHKNPTKDLAKNLLCKKLGIKLIRIREPELPELDGYSTDIRIDTLNSSCYSHLNQPIVKVLKLLVEEKEFDVNVDRDLGKIYELFQTSAKKQSIVNEYPELLKEWDYSKNDILPEKLSKGAHYKAWWKCSKCGYEWQAQVYSRCQGYGCKKCGYLKNRRRSMLK